MCIRDSTKAHGIEVRSNMYVDRLSIIMILIIGIIGSLITVYALGYMKDFQHHHSDQPDRRPWFFFVMFIFLGAMVGLVTSNNMIWMYFFWEITSLSSFWLIGFTRTCLLYTSGRQAEDIAREAGDILGIDVEIR